MGILQFAAAVLSLQLGLGALASPVDNITPRAGPSFVTETVCDGDKYVYERLAGYGFVPADARDKFGDTMSFGSSIAIDEKSWKYKDGVYTGILWGLPDRGWNTEGTINGPSRVHKFSISFTPKPSATAANPSPPNLLFTYLDTILFTGPNGTPTTGLDPDAVGSIQFPGFAPLPVATFQGDGFGGAGPGGKAIAIDSEGLVLNKDGSFWVSDEYGPYIYKFSPTGAMLEAIRPPNAILPFRNGTVSFSAASPPRYDPNRIVLPKDPTSGRNNNQGLEGLTVSKDGKSLYALMQSALNQEGGPNNPGRRPARLLEYDIKHGNPEYVGEYVVLLPLWSDPTVSDPAKRTKVAAQSEIHHLCDDRFLILARDSGAGNGLPSTTSIYRHVDIFSLKGATNIKSATNDATGGSIASAAGVLKAGIKPATYCSWLDFNINSELNKFGVTNGGSTSPNGFPVNLNEKWEGLALVPVHDSKDEYFLIAVSDNDFITQNGFINFGELQYRDASGVNLDNQALVFQVTLPKGDGKHDNDKKDKKHKKHKRGGRAWGGSPAEDEKEKRGGGNWGGSPAEDEKDKRGGGNWGGSPAEDEKDKRGGGNWGGSPAEDEKDKRGGGNWGGSPAEDEKDKRGGGNWGGSPAEDEKDKRGGGNWGGSPVEDEKDKRGGGNWGGSPAEDEKDKRGGGNWGGSPAEDEKDKRGGGNWGGSPAEDEKEKRGGGNWGGSPAEDEKEKRGGGAWGGSPVEDEKDKRGGGNWGGSPAEDEKDKRGGGNWGGSPAEDEKDKRGGGNWGGSPAEDEKEKRGGGNWGGSPAEDEKDKRGGGAWGGSPAEDEKDKRGGEVLPLRDD